MQTPTPHHTPEDDDSYREASMPFYEFATDERLPGQPSGEEAMISPNVEEVAPSQPVSSQHEENPHTAGLHILSEEAIREGLVYPPPPSYYQNMQEPKERPPLPLRQPMPLSPAQPPFVSPTLSHSPAKRSRKWVWIVIAILSVTMVASCSLCGWGIYNLTAPMIHNITGAISLVNDYYANLQNQDYEAAYQDLLPQNALHGLTIDQFIQQAHSRNTQYGPILSYVQEQPSYQTDSINGPDLSHFTIMVDVTRSHQKYKALVILDLIHGQWKITDFDRI